MQALIHRRVHDYYWKEDCSCIVTTLKIFSQLYYPELSSQIIHAAVGLNAGRCGSQCGLVQGSLLFIGVSASQRSISKEEITGLCQKFCSEFQREFGSLLCKELRPQGFSATNPPHLCENITKKAVLFSARFIEDNSINNIRR